MGIIAKVGFGLVLTGLGAAMVPGCTIRIGVGGEGEPFELGGFGGEGGHGGAGGAVGIGGQGGAGGLTPEEEAELANVDPAELSFRAGVAAYAASGTMGLVESQVADPATLDEATLTALIEQYAPGAMDQALAWASTVDPSVIPVPQGGVLVNDACQEPPYLCEHTTSCPYEGGKALCVISGCGTGQCPWCPFGGNLVFKSWCSFGCMKNGKVVMGAFKLRTIFNNWNGPWCIGW